LKWKPKDMSINRNWFSATVAYGTLLKICEGLNLQVRSILVLPLSNIFILAELRE